MDQFFRKGILDHQRTHARNPIAHGHQTVWPIGGSGYITEVLVRKPAGWQLRGKWGPSARDAVAARIPQRATPADRTPSAATCNLSPASSLYCCVLRTSIEEDAYAFRPSRNGHALVRLCSACFCHRPVRC